MANLPPTNPEIEKDVSSGRKSFFDKDGLYSLGGASVAVYFIANFCETVRERVPFLSFLEYFQAEDTGLIVATFLSFILSLGYILYNWKKNHNDDLKLHYYSKYLKYLKQEIKNIEEKIKINQDGTINIDDIEKNKIYLQKMKEKQDLLIFNIGNIKKSVESDIIDFNINDLFILDESQTQEEKETAAAPKHIADSSYKSNVLGKNINFRKFYEMTLKALTQTVLFIANGVLILITAAGLSSLQGSPWFKDIKTVAEKKNIQEDLNIQRESFDKISRKALAEESDGGLISKNQLKPSSETTEIKTSNSNILKLALIIEKKAFQAIVDGEYKESIQLLDSTSKIYPSFHSVYEIRVYLSSVSKITDEVRCEIATKYSWKAPQEELNMLRERCDY